MASAARLVALLLVCVPLVAAADEAHVPDEPHVPDATELERKLQNPITDLMIYQIFSTVESGVGEAKENRTIVNAQALLPLRVSEQWNVLAWTQVLILSLPPPVPGGARINGVGDTTQYLLVEPARIRRILWGAGLVGLLPTATNTALGAGSFGLGPAGLVSYQDQWWTVSLLAHHLRSLEGAVGRAEVTRTFLKPLVSYTFEGGAAVSLESDMTFDWRAPAGDRWIVPLQLGFGRVTLVGPVPLNLNLGVRWYPVTPTGGPSWGFRLAISFIVSITREEEQRADVERAKRQASRPPPESAGTPSTPRSDHERD